MLPGDPPGSGKVMQKNDKYREKCSAVYWYANHLDWVVSEFLCVLLNSVNMLLYHVMEKYI